MGLIDFKTDLGSIITGVGGLAKDIRTAITGKEPIDATRAAELALKAQELDMALDKAKMSIVLAEASSQDKWTSRARPSFMYVIYVMLLAGIPMGIVYAINPEIAGNVAKGLGEWLKAIPDSLYTLFGAGYLGYGAFRTMDKKK